MLGQALLFLTFLCQPFRLLHRLSLLVRICLFVLFGHCLWRKLPFSRLLRFTVLVCCTFRHPMLDRLAVLICFVRWQFLELRIVTKLISQLFGLLGRVAVLICSVWWRFLGLSIGLKLISKLFGLVGRVAFGYVDLCILRSWTFAVDVLDFIVFKHLIAL